MTDTHRSSAWSYVAWNVALANYFFPPDGSKASQAVYLTVDDSALHEIRKAKSREDSRDDFLRAVLGAARNGWNKRGLPSGVPLGLGLLCLQVYAVYTMDDADEAFSSKAYWPRLKLMLSDKSRQSYPLGLDGEIHQLLWGSLNTWLSEFLVGSRGTLRLPESGPGVPHRHIRLPLSQALLRKSDLDDLGSNVSSLAGIQPGEKLSSDTVEELLCSHLDRTSKFCQRVFAVEERRSAAWNQVADYIAFRWTESNGLEPRKVKHRRNRESFVDRLIIRWQKRPRPSLMIETAPFSEGEYGTRSRLSLAELSGLLVRPNFCKYDGFRLLVKTDGEYLEERKFGPGQMVAFLLRSDQVSRFKNSLSQVCLESSWEESPASFRAELPRNWILIRFRCRDQFLTVGEPWSSLLDRNKLQPCLAAGLRLSRKAWMVGCAPSIAPLETFFVNGKLCKQADLAKLPAGKYRVWFDGHHRFARDFELAEPVVASPISPVSWQPSDGGWPQLSTSPNGPIIGMECHLEARNPVPQQISNDVLIQRLLACQDYPRRDLSGLSVEDCIRLRELPLGRALLARLGWKD